MSDIEAKYTVFNGSGSSLRAMVKEAFNLIDRTYTRSSKMDDTITSLNERMDVIEASEPRWMDHYTSQT